MARLVPENLLVAELMRLPLDYVDPETACKVNQIQTLYIPSLIYLKLPKTVYNLNLLKC